MFSGFYFKKLLHYYGDIQVGHKHLVTRILVRVIIAVLSLFLHGFQCLLSQLPLQLFCFLVTAAVILPLLMLLVLLILLVFLVLLLLPVFFPFVFSGLSCS